VPAIVLLALLSRYTGGLTDRYGPRLPLVAGPAIAAAGFVLFVVPWSWASHWTTFLPATVVLELGLSILVPAVTTVALNSVESGTRGWPRRSTTMW
jgi:MFS family permease